MVAFPVLQSGAVTQYPLLQTLSQPVRALCFLDGSDQRFFLQGRQLRQWRIELDYLTDGEMLAVQSFFENVNGEATLFAFPDPFSGTQVLNCRLGDSSISLDYRSLGRGQVSFWVVETNG